jgi:Uma2 family endonuclease
MRLAMGNTLNWCNTGLPGRTGFRRQTCHDHRNKKITLSDYLAFTDGTDSRYELVDGALVEMLPETDLNNLISIYLLSEFLKLVPIHLIRQKGTELVVTGNGLRVRLPN